MSIRRKKTKKIDKRLLEKASRPLFIVAGVFLLLLLLGKEASAQSVPGPKNIKIGTPIDSITMPTAIVDELCFGDTASTSCRLSWPPAGSGSVWSVNGSSIYYNLGRVGIGTSIPQAGLDIARGDGFRTAGAVTFNGLSFTGGGTRVLTTSNSGNISPTFIYINGNNAGIGTASPDARLHIEHSSSAGSPNGANYPLRLRNTAWSGNQVTGIEFWNGNNKAVATSRIISQMEGNGAGGEKLYFQTQPPSGTNPNPNQPTTKLTILAAGNVGIGVENPTRLLHLGTPVGGGDYVMSAGGYIIGNLMGPILNTDAVNKEYVDSAIGAIPPPGGGDTLPPGTSGSTLRYGSTSWVSNTNLYNNGTRIGIGITNPAQQLQLTESLRLENTTASNLGVIYKGTARFIHNFQHPTGDTAVPTGRNTFIGLSAGNFTMGSTATATAHGSYNTGTGFYSLLSNTTGYYNTATGYYTLMNNNSGIHNTANGALALYVNTTGVSNSAFGSQSLRTNTSGSNNAAFGGNALYYNTSAGNNTAIGHSAMYANNGTGPTGGNNTAVGFASLYANTSGSNNTALGYMAGRYFGAGSSANQTSTNSLYLGYAARASANGRTNETVIGYNAIGIGSNTVVLGNDSVATTSLKGSVGVGLTNPTFRLTVGAPVSGNYNISAGGYIIGNLMGPILNTDAVNKEYVDSAIGAIVIPPPGGDTLPPGSSGATLRHSGLAWVSNTNIYNNGTNVGIGTTAVNNGKLTVSQVMSDYTNAFSNSHIKLLASNTVDNTGFVGATYAASTAVNYGWSVGALRSTAGQSSFVFKYHNNSVSGVERFRITPQGEVGIGTTNPNGHALYVNGGTGASLNMGGGQLTNLNAPSLPAHVVTLGYLESNYTPLWNGVLNGNIYNGNLGAGNVGIGTTTPQSKLHVVGGVSYKTRFVSNVNTTAAADDYIIAYSSIYSGTPANRTVTLPNALCTPGRFFIIMDQSGTASPSSRIIITPQSPTQIIGTSTLSISAPYNSVYVFCGDNAWFII